MRGFTLIELLVVIAILVLLTAAFPVALDRAIPGRRVAVTAQKIASAIRDAESDSLARGTPVTLQLGARGLADASRMVVDFPKTMQVSVRDQDGRALRELIVYPDGSATAARIQIRERNHSETLIVSSISGRVSSEARR